MFSIKSHQIGRRKTNNEFYVLSKGNNAGRPAHQPNANSFVVVAENEEEKELLYWLCFALWRSGACRQYLRGSVIPFLTIRDMDRLLCSCTRTASAGDIPKMVESLNNLDAAERRARQQLKLVAEMKVLIARKLLNH